MTRAAKRPVRAVEAVPLAEPSRTESATIDAHVRAAEALLFSSATPLSAGQIAQALPAGADVAAVLMRLQSDYRHRGVHLVEAGGGWRFQTAPDLAHLFQEARAEARRLPRSAMETLAVIAYHQPVTRGEIETIRGVSLNRNALDALLELGWIRPRGRRRSPGRPLTFGTTDAFLAHFGLATLDALPGKTDLQEMGFLASAQDLPGLAPGETPEELEDPLDAPPVEPTDFFTEFGDKS